MDQALLDKMKLYVDERIMNTILQSHSFDPEVVEVAKHIALERGLMSEERMNAGAKRDMLLTMAKNQIQARIDPMKVKENLLAHESDEGMVLEVLNEAARTVEVREKEEEEKKKGISPWTIVFIIFIVVRIIMRMVRNS